MANGPDEAGQFCVLCSVSLALAAWENAVVRSVLMSTKAALTWEQSSPPGRNGRDGNMSDGEVQFMSPANPKHGAVLLRLSANVAEERLIELIYPDRPLQ